MHLTEPIRSCIDDVIQSAGSGMKSMILDEFTTTVVGNGYSRSELLLREVYLFELIDMVSESQERLNHLKCIVILRPTKKNVEKLCHELDRPHYRTYHIYFTNRIGSNIISRLSQADEREVVRCVKELPLDYQAMNPFLFSMQLKNRIYDLKNSSWLPEGFKRTCDGLTSVLIALQVHPLIRYQTQSQLCKILAERVSDNIRNESLANITWRKAAPFDVNSLLLIIDRRHDLVTPITSKWTYYPLVHEHFDIVNNRISLMNVPSRQPKDPKEMIISLENDPCFSENYYKNYGELGIFMKESIERLRLHTKSQHKVETMDDMKKFIDEYPETRRYASNLHNHVFLMTEITRLVSEHNIIGVSECEQELVCSLTSQSEIYKKITRLVSSSTTRPIDALRLVCLFIICKPDLSRDLNNLIKLLKSRGDLKSEDIELVRQIREFNLSKPQNPLGEKVQHVTRMIVNEVKGVDNVLTQHRPGLSKIVEEIRKGNKLREVEFAFHGERYKETPPRKLIVFYVGGVTLDEALIADHYNRLGDMKIVVGGTSVLNFKSFIEEVRQVVALSRE